VPIKSGKKVMGAIEISKDITEVKKLSEQVVNLQAELYSENLQNKKTDSNGAVYTFADIIGTSEEMLILKKNALAASDSPSPVLVYGETGTGKELLVHAIHNASPRRNKPFIAQNCAALPESLLESILFGTVKGAFTGAETRPGLFEIADGGTLFLDEINSMSLPLQAKLLMVIQDRNVRRIGDTKTTYVDVRIMTAINTDPLKAVKEKTIRDDVFYRLSVISLRMPELGERRDDIPALLEHFIKKYNKKLNKRIKGVSKDVMEFFMDYSWPGNIRELEHTIEGSMNLAEGSSITKNNLPYYLMEAFNAAADSKGTEVRPLKETLMLLEKQLIEEALLKSGRNITKAAEILDIPRQTLQYKISKHRLIGYDAEN
jgi:arginine utilization regulatory protein